MCDYCDPTHASPDPVVVRLEREVELKGQDLMKVQKALVEALAHIDVLNFDLCQCRSELTTAREIAHRLGTERDDLVARRAEANAEVKRLTTAWRAIDRANVSLRERLAAAQTRNVCPECGLTPGAISTCYCEECVGEIKEKLAAAEAERIWTCGCGIVNGVNLATCRVCGRKEGEQC